MIRAAWSPAVVGGRASPLGQIVYGENEKFKTNKNLGKHSEGVMI